MSDLKRRILNILPWVFMVGAGLSAYRWLSPILAREPGVAIPPVEPRPHRAPNYNFPYPEILVDASWLRAHLEGNEIIVADARDSRRFEAGHIPGSVSFDPAGWDGDPWHLGQALARVGIDEDKVVVCIADGKDREAGGKLFWLLELAGNKQARVLRGGLQAWVTGGGELEDGRVAPRRGSFHSDPDTTLIATFDYVMRVFGTQGHTVMDGRDEATWAAGHIPHSLPFPLSDLVGKDGSELESAMIRLQFEEWGPRDREYVDLADEIIVGGDFSPEAPIHPYLAARLAGIEQVRVYPGGFAEWQSRPQAPIARLITTAELRARLHAEQGKKLTDKPPHGFVLFDLRENGDFSVGHIPGAVHVSPDEFNDRFESVIKEEWPQATSPEFPIVFYCYGPLCTRSRNCSTLAARHGHLVLEWYREGLDGWRAANEAVSSN